jgi:serine/threonine protein kinase
LNHTNIATIHNIEEVDDEIFIVMEYIDGKELKDKIKSGLLAIDETLNHAIQMVNGLQAAHEKDVIHRDIKSSNIMITAKDQLKIMDFGLAKVRGGAEVTKVGTTLGTAAYMSPEQARGEEADQRSDIWSFGVVFFEMLTGELPFGGEFEQAVTYAILHEEPEPLANLRPEVPESFQKIVTRTLAKDPQERYQSTNELLKDLQAISSSVSTPEPAFSLSKQILKPKIFVPIIVLLIGLALFLTWWIPQNAKINLARNETIPQLDSLVSQISWMGEGPASWKVFRLALRAEEYIPNDPGLKKLWPRMSRLVKIHSDPPGAQVYAKPYMGDNTEWLYFGQTPLDSLRFPRGFSRLKIELAGFQTVEDLFWARRDSQFYKLSDPSELPAGMVIVEGASRKLRMPGLDHLKAESVNRFLIDRYEVTNQAYKKFVAAGGYSDPTYWKHPFIMDGRKMSWEEAISYFKDKTGRQGPANWEVGDFADGKDNFPVTGISWYEAAAYAEFVGKSLPTVFHWNLVALTWASGVVIPVSNFSGKGLAAVGSYNSMTRYNTYDMAGNAREWVLNKSSQ